MESGRRLRRFFSHESIPVKGEFFSLSSSESHHLNRIIRLQEGDQCLVVDGQGCEATVEVCHLLEGKGVVLKVLNLEYEASSQAGVQVYAYPSLAQRGKLDSLVEKGQELGLRGFCAIQSDFSSIKPNQDAREKLCRRWQKKIEQAAKQSGAKRLTVIAPVQSFKNGLSSIPPEEKIIIFHPDPEARHFRDWIQDVKAQKIARLHLFFGPEGGFSNQEILFGKKLVQEKKIKSSICLFR